MDLLNEIFEDLVPVDWNELESTLLAPGEIFFRPNSKAKAVRMLKVGDLIDNTFLGKYQLIKEKLFIRKMKSNQELLFADFIGENIKLSRKERLERKESFVRAFVNDVWLDTDQEHFEIYVYTCFNIFSSFERSILLEIENSNQMLFRRAMVVAALGIFIAHCMDCNDFEFMKELYNSLFCLDVGLLYPKADYHLIQALKKEQSQSGAGVDYLAHKKNEDNKKRFKEHMFDSIKIIENTWDLTFKDDKIYNIIKYHHEHPDKKGFPHKISGKQLFHWEEMAYFLDQWIPFDQECFDLEKLQNRFYHLEDRGICFEYIVKWLDYIQGEEGVAL